MKRTEAERLYKKYSDLGAKVEFKFDKRGSVEAIEINVGAGPSLKITLTDTAVTIYGEMPRVMAEMSIDLLLTGKS